MCPELIATGFGKAEAPSDKSLYPYFSSPSTPRRLPWLRLLLIRPRCSQTGARWPGRGRGFGDEQGRDTDTGVGWPGKGRRAGRRRSPGGRCQDRATFPRQAEGSMRGRPPPCCPRGPAPPPRSGRAPDTAGFEQRRSARTRRPSGALPAGAGTKPCASPCLTPWGAPLHPATITRTAFILLLPGGCTLLLLPPRSPAPKTPWPRQLAASPSPSSATAATPVGVFPELQHEAVKSERGEKALKSHF